MQINKWLIKTILSVFVFFQCGFSSYKVDASQSIYPMEQIQQSYLNHEYRKTIKLANQYLLMHPEDMDANYFIGFSYYQLQDNINAAHYFYEVLKTNPKYTDVRLALIQIARHNNNYTEALKLTTEGLAIFPNQTELLIKKTEIYNEMNQPEQAFEVVQHLLKTAPDYGPVQNIVTGLTLNKDLDEIRASYHKANYQRTIELGQQYKAQHPDNLDVDLFLAYSYFQLKKYQDATTIFTDIITKQPNYMDARIGLIQVEMAQQKFINALQLIEQGLAISKDNADLLYKRSQIFAAQNNFKRASESLNLLLSKHPNYLPATQLLEKIKSAQNQGKKLADKSSTKDKAIYSISLDSLKKLIETGHAHEAKRQAINHLKKYPNDTDVRFLLARIYMNEENFADAVVQYEKILQHQPEDMEAFYGLINALFSLKQYDEALYLLNMRILERPNNATLLYKRAIALNALNLKEEAIKTLQSISSFDETAEIRKLYEEINNETHFRYLNYFQVGTYDSIMSVTNPSQIWTLSSVYLNYHSPDATVGGRINYQTRPGLKAAQYEFDFNPQITDSTYANIAYATSNQPLLFPNHLLYGEIFQDLPLAFETSLGDTYRKIESSILNAYTGSLAKYVGDYRVEFRPTHFVPGTGPKSTMYRMGVRRYFENAEKFIGLIGATGTSPDLDNLTTVNFFKIKDHVIFLEGQYPFNIELALQYGLGYEKQIFPSGLVKQFWYFNFGLRFRDL